MDTMLQTDQPSDPALTFRRAAASDAAALALLVFVSSRRELDWLPGTPPATCEALLRRAIATPSGRFSWKHHLVATIGGQPTAALTIQDGRYNWLDDLHVVRDLLQHFGLRCTLSITRHGLTLESETPVPTRR